MKQPDYNCGDETRRSDIPNDTQKGGGSLRLRLWIYALVIVGCSIWILWNVVGFDSLAIIPLLVFVAIIVSVVLVLTVRKRSARPSRPLKGLIIARLSAWLLAFEFLLSMLVDANGELLGLGQPVSTVVFVSVFGGYIGTGILLLRRDKRWRPYVAVGLALTILLLGPAVYAFQEVILRFLS